MTYLDFLEQKVLLERLVIGLEEPVLIKGLGELSAKIDSGNGGYNVIHGTDFHQQGNELMFTTHDSFGHEKKIQAAVIDTIEVNMGGGNIENRPVIELDIKFAGEDYKKIPFSVSDRSSNTNPILISKGFVEKELEALIDVGAKNISSDGIDVVYGEGWLGGIGKGIVKGAKIGAGLIGGIKKAGGAVMNGLRATDKFLKGGDDVNPFAPVLGIAAGALGLTGAVVGGLIGVCGLIKDASSLVKQDTKKVRQKLLHSVLSQNINKDKNNITKGTVWQYKTYRYDKVPIVPVASFKGRAGDVEKGKVISGMEQRIQDWKQAIKLAEKGTKEAKNDAKPTGQKNTTNKTQEQQEEVIFSEALSLLEDMAAMYYADKANRSNPTSSTSTPTSTKPATPNLPPVPPAVPKNGQGQQQNKEQQFDPEKMKISQQQSDKIKNVTTEFKQLNNFIIYYIPTSIQNDGGADNMKKFLQSGKLDNILLKLFNIGQISKGSITPIIKDIVKNLRTANDNNIEFQGCFALATGDKTKRVIEIFENSNEAIIKTIDKNPNRGQDQKTNPNTLKSIQAALPQLRKQMAAPTVVLKNKQIANLCSEDCQDAIDGIQSMQINTNYIQDHPDYILGDKGLGPYIANGDIPQAIAKFYLKSKGYQNVIQLLDKELGNNWGITNYKELVYKMASLPQIEQIFSSKQSPPQSNETSTPGKPKQEVTTDTESEEEPLSDDQLWVRKKINHFRNKGIM